MNKTQKKHVYISIFAVLLFGFLFFQEPKIKDAAEAVRLGNYYFNGAGGYDLEKAEAGFTKAVEIDPKILWGHYQLARVYFVKGEKDRALEEINKELEVNPENLRSLYVRGLIYESSGKLAEAEADFKRFVLWAPKEWAGYNDLAWILAKEGKYREAKEVLLEGEGTEQVEAKAGGLVSIYNNHSSDQPLVSTTRLLTPEGILFRIDDGVTVPSGGSVSVMAHADVIGASGNIGPAKFTIPGLSVSLQEKIYAESVETMTGGVAFVRLVTEEDLEQAAQSLRDEMLEAAKITLRLEAGGSYSGEAFFDEILERKSDTIPGSEAQAVSVSLSMRVVGVFFQKENLLDLAEMKLLEKIKTGLELTGFDESNVSYSVARYDVDGQLANIDVTAKGKASLAPTSDLLDLEVMLGKSPAEVKASLEASDAIQSVQISFTPFWLQRMPTLKDHIKIVIE